MITELYTYIETLNPQTMADFLTAATNMLPENYWLSENIVKFYNYGEEIGNIQISSETVAGKITGIVLFRQLQKVPGFYSLLRGTTYAKDLDDKPWPLYSDKEEEEE